MSVMAARVTAVPSGPIRTQALAGWIGLPRLAAATPSPTSQLPSRTAPGAALRRLQPNSSAPLRRQGTMARVE